MVFHFSFLLLPRITFTEHVASLLFSVTYFRKAYIRLFKFQRLAL